MQIANNLNLVLIFLLELGVLVGLGWWGFAVGSNLVWKLLFAGGSIALAVVVWAYFGAPTARYHLTGIWRYVLLLVFYGTGTLAFWFVGQQRVAIIFAILCIVTQVLVPVLGDEWLMPGQ